MLSISNYLLQILNMDQDSGLVSLQNTHSSDNYNYNRSNISEKITDTKKEINILKTVLVVSIVLLCLALVIVFNLSQSIRALNQDSVTHKTQIFELKKSNKLSSLKMNNISMTLQGLKHEFLVMALDIVKNQNRQARLFELTRDQKREITKHNSNTQEAETFNKDKILNILMEVNSKQYPFLPLPKIAWIYTEFKYENSKMIEQMFGNFIITKARESGYQIRIVDSWSAYEWLSKETSEKVTKTMQNMKVEEKVNEILKMALLMEHGGIIFRVSESFLIDDLKWIESYFDPSNPSKLTTGVVLFTQQEDSTQPPEYQDFFIAAVKETALITDTFNTLCEVISTGKMKFHRLRAAKYKNTQMNSTKVKDITKNILNSLLQIMNPKFYSVITINIDISMFVKPQCREKLSYLLKRPEWEYQADCGISKHIIHISDAIDRSGIEDQMENQLVNNQLGADQYGYWHTLMVIQENRKLFDPLPARPVSFCIIDAHPNSDNQLLTTSFEKLKQQNYINWTAVYFVNQQSKINIDYAQKQRELGFKMTLVPHTGSVGRNYEIGIIKHCPNKSFALILGRKESILDPENLNIMSYKLKQRQVLGAFVELHTKNKLRYINRELSNYNKAEYNGRDPKYQVLSEILNHLRIFHTDCYKIIPQFALRTPEGVYFNDRFVFLQQFLYMVQNKTDKHDDTQIPHEQKIKWFIKSNSHIFDVPNIILNDRNLIIQTNNWQQVDKTQLYRHSFKTDSYAMTYNMDHLVQNGIPMTQFAVFNPANQYQPYTERNKPDLIPKKIHIIWINGKMPPAKAKILQMNRQLYPDFQFKIWSQKNITKQKFPLSYDILNNIYNINNESRYSRLASMADVLRHQVLYYQGGFYMDTSMVLFNNIFYKMLSYKFVISTERIFRHRWAQSMCIFGVMPKFPGLLREISPNNTNRYNIFLRDALEIAGPHDFRWMVRGYQQYDPDYLVMDYEAFYPMTYSLPNFFETYCYTQKMFLKKQDKVVLEEKDRYMISNCGDYYPFSFGKEINSIGSSWQNPKW